MIQRLPQLRLHQLDEGNALAVRDQPTASFVSLGARAAKVFEEAGAVAERLIGEAQEQARAIIEVQKKVAEILGIPLKSQPDDESD